MLRSGVIAAGVIALVCGVAALVTGVIPPALVALGWGILLLLGTVWEKVRYKPLETASPGSGWVATDERFIDDETGKPVRVRLEPATGERRYVTE
ncbi:MAG: hypothetical protein JOZ72_16550 [Alphaproteobacteria bacterium]|nr:hypothetical protein [Alphaproteobacteria bacterium]